MTVPAHGCPTCCLSRNGQWPTPQSFLVLRHRSECDNEPRQILVEDLDKGVLCSKIQRSTCVPTGQQHRSGNLHRLSNRHNHSAVGVLVWPQTRRVWLDGLATPKIGQTLFHDTHFLFDLSNISFRALRFTYIHHAPSAGHFCPGGYIFLIDWSTCFSSPFCVSEMLSTVACPRQTSSFLFTSPISTASMPIMRGSASPVQRPVPGCLYPPATA